jgi:predicted dehydrogenase
MTKSAIIIGLGQIGMGYDYDQFDKTKIFTHAYAIEKHSKFKLVGAVETSIKQKNRFKKRYALPLYNDPALAVKELKPDVVVISTPTQTHRTILLKVVNAYKPKIILCEKPLSYDLSEAKNMVKLCKEAGIELFVNYMRRVDRGVLEIKKRIEIGEISTPIKANVWYSKGLLNNGSHFLDLLSFWLGKAKSTLIINKGRLWNNFDPEPDFKIDFNLGTAIFRSAWEESFSHYTIELLSHSGRLLYDYSGSHIEWQKKSEDPYFAGYSILNKRKEILENSMDIYQLRVYDSIYKYLIGETTTLCTGSESLENLKKIDLIIKQRRNN